MNNVHAELDAIQMQTIINQSRIDSLESCYRALNRCAEFLGNCDDCFEENIDKATTALKEVMWRVKRQAEECDEDFAVTTAEDDAKEQIKLDWNQRVRDAKEHTR